MDDRRLEFGVGVLVLAAIGVAVILTFVFGAFPVLLRSEYPITAKFPSVAGVNVDSAVMKNGYPIGRVREIVPVDDGAEVMMLIEDRYMLRQGEVPRIGAPKLVTGEARVEFVPASERQKLLLFDGKGQTPPDKIIQPDEAAIAQRPIPKNGYYVNVDGNVASDPFGMLMEFGDEIKDMLASIEKAGNSVDQLATSLRTNVETMLGGNQQQVGDVAKQAAQAIDQFTRTFAELEAILKDEQLRQGLSTSMERFPVVLSDASDTLRIAQGTFQSFENVGDSVNDTIGTVDRTVRNIERFTLPLADNADDLVDNVMRSLENLDLALAQVADFGEQLNQGDGTIKRLIEDDELYFQIRRIAGNIEQLTTRLRPIADDARVFADKIARDPGVIGLRGVLNRRPQGAGFK